MFIGSEFQAPEHVLSEDIAKFLASNAWHLCTSNLLHSYLVDMFGAMMPEPPSIKTIFVSEAEGGDYERGQLFEMGQWWEIDSDGFRSCHVPLFLHDVDNPTNSINGYYYTPYLRFFESQGGLVIGETYGPNMLVRMRAQLVVSDKNIRLDNQSTHWEMGPE